MIAPACTTTTVSARITPKILSWCTDMDRPARVRCNTCEWVYTMDHALRAPNPFDPSESIYGCPNCKSVEDFVRLCDRVGCDNAGSCGQSTPDRYQVTCYDHRYPQ